MRGEEYVCAEELDDDAVGNGDAEAESDSDAADDELLQACLPVSGKPLPPGDGPPKDADEYLRQVQWERMHCPEVVEADIEEKPPRPRKRPGLVGRNGGLLAHFGAELPEAARARREWVEDATAAFRDLRAHNAVRSAEVAGEERLTFDAWREHCRVDRPSSELLLAQDFVSINQLFVVAVEQLVEAAAAATAVAAEAESATPAVGPTISAAEGAFEADGGRLAEWAFSALLFVEEPLVDDIMYQLQRLRRTCQDALAAAHARGEPEEAATSLAIRGRAALLLTVVEEVFGQR